MKTLTCPDLTPDIVRGWLGNRLDEARAAEVRQHLRGCQDCFKSLMGTTSENLFRLLSGSGKEQIPSFMEQVARTLDMEPVPSNHVTQPLSAMLQELLATTRELLWEPFSMAPIPAMSTLSGGSSLAVQEVDAKGAVVGSALVLSVPANIQEPPVLSNTGRFRFALHGSDARLAGKQLACDIQLIEGKSVSLRTSIRAASDTNGWTAVFDEALLTDPATLAKEDYRIPFDHLTLTVQSSTAIPEKSLPSYLKIAACKADFRRLCDALNEAFDRASSQGLRKSEIEEVIRSHMGDISLQVRGRVVDVLQELEKQKFVYVVSPASSAEVSVRAGEVNYKARWRFSSQYLINRFWGIPVEGGLKLLLEGGLSLKGEGGTSILLEGVPGVGKTMFALHLAKTFAVKGYPAVYVTTQGDAELFIERLALLGYRLSHLSGDGSLWLCSSRNHEFTFRIRDLRRDAKEGTRDASVSSDTRHILTLLMVDSDWWGTDSQVFLNALKRLQEDVSRQSCLVFDCLDDVWGDIGTGSSRFLDDMLNLQASQLGVFLSSGSWPSETVHQQIQQKVDIIIQLTMHMREATVPDRAIEITKCTSQGFIRGRHYFSTGRPDGLVVYPSSRALHSVWVKRRPLLQKPIPEKWRVDDYFDLNQVVGNDIVRGAAVLLSGKQSTHRLPIGLSFLSSGLESDKNADVVLLSLKDGADTLFSIIQNYPQFHALLSEKHTEFSSRVEMGYLAPDRFGPERILDWMRQVLASRLDKGSQVRRVLVSSLSQLRQSPLFGVDTTFIPALVQLFKKEGVTALFIDTAGNESKSIGGYFDVILSTDQVNSDSEHEATQIRVEYTALCKAGHAPHQIRRMRADARGTLDDSGHFYILKLLAGINGETSDSKPERHRKKSSL